MDAKQPAQNSDLCKGYVSEDAALTLTSASEPVRQVRRAAGPIFSKKINYMNKGK